MMADPLPILDDAASLGFEYDDVRLAGYGWWATGVANAPTVLMLHGWGEDASTLAPVARKIKNRGWHAVSISLRGWRGSTGIDDYGLSAAKDIGRVLDWIRQRSPNGPTVLLGFSMGGLMAGLAAAEQEELAGLVVVGAPCHLPSFYQDTEFGGVRRNRAGEWQEPLPTAGCSIFLTWSTIRPRSNGSGFWMKRLSSSNSETSHLWSALRE